MVKVADYYVLFRAARTLRNLADTIINDYRPEHSECLTTLQVDLQSAHSHICGLINEITDIEEGV